MGEFVCRVADANGRVFSHVEPAGSLAEARQKLVERGLYVYSVETRSSLLGAFSKRRSERQDRRLGLPDPQPAVQYPHQGRFADSPRTGSSWRTAPPLPSFVPCLSKVRDRVREGKSLSEAISEAGVFSKVYATAILAGEKSGNLSGVLDYYIAYQRVSTGVKKKILATLVYPVLLITVATIIVTYLVTFVIPKFAMLYRDLNVELPGPTQFLIALTVDYRYVVIGAFALLFLAAFGILLWSRTEEGGERSTA